MRLLILCICLLAACGQPDEAADDAGTGASGFQQPVLTNANPPVRFPPELFENGVDGSVLLRLYVDETGTVNPDSTLIAQSSGIAELDSAALLGVPRMRFAPATRDGEPVAMMFLQPVTFQHDESLLSEGAQP